MSDIVSIAEAEKILEQRNQPLGLRWIQKKAAAGEIPGAVKIGSEKRGTWLIPREWAETYIKDTRGRKRAEK